MDGFNVVERRDVNMINGWGGVTPKELAANIDDHLSGAARFTKFSAELDLRYDAEVSRKSGKDYWKVITPFKFYVGERADDTWVYVHEGYYSDGASVPRFLWWFMPRWGKHGPAVVVHDLLCDRPVIFVKGVPTRVTQKQSDKIFLEAMEVCKVNRRQRYIVYYAVRFYQKFIRRK